MAHAASAKKGKLDSERVRLSKSLSWLLRHGVSSTGLLLQPGGFLYVTDVMKLPQFSRYTVDDVRLVVENCEKKRFALATDPESGQLKIRANQGHTVEVDDLELTPVRDSAEAPTVVHGTNMTAWQSIKSQGLRKMRRNHIHFAVGEPGADGVISGEELSFGSQESTAGDAAAGAVTADDLADEMERDSKKKKKQKHKKKSME